MALAALIAILEEVVSKYKVIWDPQGLLQYQQILATSLLGLQSNVPDHPTLESTRTLLNNTYEAFKAAAKASFKSPLYTLSLICPRRSGPYTRRLTI